jgi:hypothetical protein
LEKGVMKTNEDDSCVVEIKELRKYENSYLRAEIETNKKMIFERALLIAGAAFGATLLPNESKGIEFLGILSIVALFFNLWFAHNRLKSSMRIIAYIQLFHEAEDSIPWIGWENAVRVYRIWEEIFKKNEEEFFETAFKKIKQNDRLSFYIPIVILHISIALAIAVYMLFRIYWLRLYGEIEKYLYCGVLFENYILLYTIVFAIYIIFILIKCNPYELKSGIEKERIRWISIMESFRLGRFNEYLQVSNDSVNNMS